LLSWQAGAQSFEQQLRSALDEQPKIVAYLDGRNAFISATNVKVFGIKAGMQYAETITFGIGYNQLSTTINNEISFRGHKEEVELAYWYFSPYLEYIFFRDKRWELMIPLQFGLGSSFYKLKEDRSTHINHGFVISYEPGIAFQYRLLTYFGAGFGVGYRFMILPNREVEEKFTAPVYMLKFKVYFEDLYKDIFKGKEPSR
jgi:hypothetical protein